MKYLVIGAEPFRVYTGTTTYTSLRCLGVANSVEEAHEIVQKNFDECSGLLAVFNTETGEQV